MKSKNKYSFFYFKYKNAKVVYVPLAHMSVSIFSDNRSFQLANSLYAVQDVTDEIFLLIAYGKIIKKSKDRKMCLRKKDVSNLRP